MVTGHQAGQMSRSERFQTSDDDPLLMYANDRRMNEVALEIFRMGHLPLTGEAIALPLIEVAGSQTIGDAVWNEIFHPVGRRLVAQVDAVLRIGGPSIGADEMVSLARSTGKPVYLFTDGKTLLFYCGIRFASR